MSKENKIQQPVSNNKKYIALALVVLLAIIGIVMNNSSEEETIVASTKPEVTANVTEEKPVEELTVARIDITTKLVNAEKPQFEVYVDEDETPRKQTPWMPKFGIQGYDIQRNGKNLDIEIKALQNTEINLVLRGPDKRDENKQFVPAWVKYTSLTINGEEILTEPKSVWHNKPFIHVINAKAGEEYKIHAEWTKADTIPEE